MTAQTSYSVNKSAAFAGMLADLTPREIVSKLAEGAVPVGVAVGRGTADDQVVKGGDGVYFGVSLMSQTLEASDDAGNVAYPDEGDVSVLKSGWCWVAIQNTGSPGDALSYADATGLISTGAAGAGATDIPNATLESTVASGGDLGLIRLG